MLNRATALLNFADENAQFQRRYCSISPAEALNFNAVCSIVGFLKERGQLEYEKDKKDELELSSSSLYYLFF